MNGELGLKLLPNLVWTLPDHCLFLLYVQPTLQPSFCCLRSPISIRAFYYYMKGVSNCTVLHQLVIELQIHNHTNVLCCINASISFVFVHSLHFCLSKWNINVKIFFLYIFHFFLLRYKCAFPSKLHFQVTLF